MGSDCNIKDYPVHSLARDCAVCKRHCKLLSKLSQKTNNVRTGRYTMHKDFLVLLISMRKMYNINSLNQSIISAEKITKLSVSCKCISLSLRIYKYLDGWVYAFTHFNTYKWEEGTPKTLLTNSLVYCEHFKLLIGPRTFTT